jgi:hypothetical protein
MTGKRYFILEETISQDHVESMMGRVVIFKTLPINQFAPFAPTTSNEPSHNTNDIIPSILPSPCMSSDRNDFFQAVSGPETHFALSAFFSFDFENKKEESAALHSEQVKRYTLPNPEQFFHTLLKNELYARDVRTILKASSAGRAYFVTGFLTITGATWTRKTDRARKGGLTTSMPIIRSVGLAIPGPMDLGMNSVHASTFQNEQDMSVVEEEIFAMSYSTVKLAYRFEPSTSRFLATTLVMGPPKRAKAHHLALGHDSDEEVEYDSEDDDGEHEKNDKGREQPEQFANSILWEDSEELLFDAPGTSFVMDC